jgi:hypothetical protein
MEPISPLRVKKVETALPTVLLLLLGRHIIYRDNVCRGISSELIRDSDDTYPVYVRVRGFLTPFFKIQFVHAFLG